MPVPPAVGLCEDESVNGAPFYVMGFVEGPILRTMAEAEVFPERGRAPGDRRAGRRHAGRDPRRRPRRGRPRRPGAQGGLRRPPAQPLARPVGEAADPRAAAGRRGPRPTRRADPRAGPGDDRPRRLPPRQHDPVARGRGRRGRRLGALHARRPARRRRPAARLLVRAGRRARSRCSSRPRWRPASRPARRSRPATRSAPAATSREIDFYVALGLWKLAIILEGVYARYAAGQYGKPTDEGFEEFARLVERLVEAAAEAEARLG